MRGWCRPGSSPSTGRRSGDTRWSARDLTRGGQPLARGLVIVQAADRFFQAVDIVADPIAGNLPPVVGRRLSKFRKIVAQFVHAGARIFSLGVLSAFGADTIQLLLHRIDSGLKIVDELIPARREGGILFRALGFRLRVRTDGPAREALDIPLQFRGGLLEDAFLPLPPVVRSRCL